MKGDYFDSNDLFNDCQIRKSKKGWTKKNIMIHLQKIADKHYDSETEKKMIDYFKSTGDFKDGAHWFCHDLCLNEETKKTLVYVLKLRDGTTIVRHDVNREGGCIQPLRNDFVSQLVHCGASFQCIANDVIVYNAPFQFLL